MSRRIPVLEVAGLSKSYGALQVARDVSLNLSGGEALGVIGPNGAGKTTLFNLLTGTVRADRGRVTLFGRDVTDTEARTRCRMGLARSFQVPQPFGGLTVYENALAAAVFGQGLSEGRAGPHARDALERTGLWAKAALRAGDLTLLDRKRLELARSIATAPRLLLLDEIAGGLTDAESNVLVDLILAIKAEGIAIIWIEHVLHALLRVVDRVVVLDFGQVIAEGEPRSILQRPEVAAVYLGLDPEAQEAARA